MPEAIDTIRNTCNRLSQEERAQKTPKQRLLKELSSGCGAPLASPSRVMEGTAMTGKAAISVTTAAAPDSSCFANHGKRSCIKCGCRTPRRNVLCQRPAKAAGKPRVISPALRQKRHQ